MTTMLIVEDNKLFRTTLREALNLRFPSLEVDEAEDVAGALVKLRKDLPDLALLDICLPDGSGLELASTILLDWPKVPVAICTSHDMPEYREAAGRIGVRSFLVKGNLDWNEFSKFIFGHTPPAPGEFLWGQVE